MKKPVYTWDEDSGVALCVIEYNGQIFKGLAYCANPDLDVKSEKTGSTIATYRAEIACLKHIRDNEIIPQLKALNQLYYSMKHSTHFNPDGYENKRLQTMIHKLTYDLTTVKQELLYKKKILKEFIENKEQFAQKLRHIRKINTLDIEE